MTHSRMRPALVAGLLLFSAGSAMAASIDWHPGTMIWQSAAVFAAMFSLDYGWARYTAAITSRSAATAGAYAAAIIVLSGVTTIGYTGNPWLLIPAVAGAFAGTFTAVRWG